MTFRGRGAIGGGAAKPVGLTPSYGVVLSSCHVVGPFCVLPLALRRTGASGLRLQDGWSTSQRLVQHVEKAEEGRLPWIPGQEPIDDSPARANDLRWNVDPGVSERGEVHPQQASFFFFVLFFPAPLFGKQQGGPSFQAPGQRGHDHVGPVADEVVDGRRQRIERRSFVARSCSLGCSGRLARRRSPSAELVPIVRDVEETSLGIEEFALPLADFQILPDDHHTIGLFTLGRRVRETPPRIPSPNGCSRIHAARRFASFTFSRT